MLFKGIMMPTTTKKKVKLTIAEATHLKEVAKAMLEQWKVTVHYQSGEKETYYETLADALQWSGQAIRQMGWPNRKHSKVTIERIHCA